MLRFSSTPRFVLNAVSTVAARLHWLMPSAFAFAYRTPSTDRNVATGERKKVRDIDIACVVQPRRLSLGSADHPRPAGKKRIEIHSPQRDQVAAATSAYRDERTGRVCKANWAVVKQECVRAGVVCCLDSIKKIGVKWSKQRKTGTPIPLISVRLAPRALTQSSCSYKHRGALRGTPGSACPQPEPNATELPSCAHI